MSGAKYLYCMTSYFKTKPIRTKDIKSYTSILETFGLIYNPYKRRTKDNK